MQKLDPLSVVTVLVILIVFNWYFKPESEKLTCDQNYLCKVEQIRLGKSKTKEFQLSPNSFMNVKKRNIGWRSTKYVYSVIFIENFQEHNPFVYYTYDYENLTNKNKDIARFKLYKLNPKDNNFTLRSKAGTGILHSFIPSLIIWTIICVSIALKNANRYF